MHYNAFIVCGQMSDGTTEQLKRFLFTSKFSTRGEPIEENLEIVIPEVFRLKKKKKIALCSVS